MKFETGDAIDHDHCVVLTHEFLRCEDSFTEFHRSAEELILQGQTKERSYKTYNAYTRFIHHLYEFLMGCHARDAGNTKITNKKGEDRTIVIDHYVMHHAQRVMNNYCEAIKNGTAPSWVNDIKYYDVVVPTDFAKDFREYRNKAIGHVAYERASQLSLSEFYQKYHKFLYYLYEDSISWWGRRAGEFPDLKEITDFILILRDENA